MIIAVNLGLDSIYNQLLVSGIINFATGHGDITLWFSDPRIVNGETPGRLDGIIGRKLPGALGKDTENTPIIDVTSGDVGETFQVCCDNEGLVQLAVDHFYQHKFRNIAYLHINHHVNSLARKEYFIARCKDVGCVPYVIAVDTADQLRTTPPRDLLEAIETLPKPVGLFLPDDPWCKLIFKSCDLLNIDIPEEVSILGMNNNTEFCLSCQPPLSSIDINVPQIGYVAAKTLCHLIDGNAVPDVQKIAPKELVRRESTTSAVRLSIGVSKVIDFMHANLSEPIVMDDLVDVQLLGRRALEKAFQLEVGESPMHYLRTLRLERVRFLLKTTELSVAEISRQCGFTHSTYLCRLFRKFFDITPQEYRKTKVTI